MDPVLNFMNALFLIWERLPMPFRALFYLVVLLAVTLFFVRLIRSL